jgi:hypothetical protein
MLEIACPKCSQLNYIVDKEMVRAAGYSPIKCSGCSEVYLTWANIDTEAAVSEYSIRPVPIPVEIPPVPIGQSVALTNKDHPRFGSSAVVVDKNHKRYRVKFDDGVILWLPDHWVSRDNCRNRRRDDGP